jgi:hypothetical protein
VAQRGRCGFPESKIAGSCYSQWNELKLTNIEHQRTLFPPLYSELSPRRWLFCGVAQRGRCGFPESKMAGSCYSQWNELKLTNIEHQRTLFPPLYSDLSPRRWLFCGVAERGRCGYPGSKMAGSCYSQWNELKLTDIEHQRTLFPPLYSELSPRRWLFCGVAQRGRCGFPRSKIAGSFYSQWNELKLTNIEHQRTLFLPLYSDLSPRGWLSFH